LISQSIKNKTHIREYIKPINNLDLYYEPLIFCLLKYKKNMNEMYLYLIIL